MGEIVSQAQKRVNGSNRYNRSFHSRGRKDPVDAYCRFRYRRLRAIVIIAGVNPILARERRGKEVIDDRLCQEGYGPLNESAAAPNGAAAFFYSPPGFVPPLIA